MSSPVKTTAYWLEDDGEYVFLVSKDNRVKLGKRDAPAAWRHSQLSEEARNLIDEAVLFNSPHMSSTDSGRMSYRQLREVLNQLDERHLDDEVIVDVGDVYFTVQDYRVSEDGSDEFILVGFA